MKAETFMRLLVALMIALIIISIIVVIAYPIEACPGGEAVYAYTDGSFYLASFMVLICTTTIIIFAINIREYLRSNGYSKKFIVISFVWVLITAILNVITFMFFINKEEVYMSGATSNIEVFDIFMPLLIAIPIIGIVCFLYSYLRGDVEENIEN